MQSLNLFGTRLVVGDMPPAAPDNNNWKLKEDWMTPAELLQWVRRTREAMRRELAADFSLRDCPKHRRRWDNLEAIERCALWHYYGVRAG